MVDLTRPIVGIENRTAQEVFDIMVDRFKRQTPPQDHVRGRSFWIWRNPGSDWQVSEDEPAASGAPDVECYCTGSTMPAKPSEDVLDAIVQGTRASVSYADAREIYEAVRAALAASEGSTDGN